ncbi:DUF624 domain-containing protein [Halanaerobium praevalens]|uniref:Integral membrane protein n=1 Tax=Halanaerobium praevalens (strain ATCC 33744 / DSM 2228 / GSL) TaxID=572479 RepID=E3DS34_HALPG|nr:DUF624 domain-containing protein [Halanaerobium praevalens]ADO78182.1 protein of unknown function DUF624 [Halanaerobium praevalens DSM 2228]
MQKKYLNYDGPLFSFFKLVYKILLLNFLWLFFSLALVSIGASTTALFYLSFKLVNKESIASIPQAFYQSFKLNFKKASLIWLILLTAFYLIYVNLININLIPVELAKYIYFLQLVVFFELLLISIYIFPLLARHHVDLFNAFKASFVMANRHFLTTIKCLSFFPLIYLVLSWNSFFVLFTAVFYALWVAYILKGLFIQYRT